MAEYIVPNIRRHYEYQPNALMCWAAVGLTLWRSKHGRGGRGATMDTLVGVPGGERYARILDYATELNEQMGGSTDLSTLPAAETAVRRAKPQFQQVPSGLPDTWANDFFTFLGCRSTPLSGIDGAGLKALVRQKGPIAIFQRNPGHLKLIVGTWDSDPANPQGPQVIMFDPETYIVALANSSEAYVDTATLREQRWLWVHWRQYYANSLVGGCGWHF